MHPKSRMGKDFNGTLLPSVLPTPTPLSLLPASLLAHLPNEFPFTGDFNKNPHLRICLCETQLIFLTIVLPTFCRGKFS